MKTLVEKEWPGVAGGTSVSIERSSTSAKDDAGLNVAATYTFVLLIIGRYTRRTRLAHVGVMHWRRRPLGVAALVGGKLRQRWVRGLSSP